MSDYKMTPEERFVRDEIHCEWIRKATPFIMNGMTFRAVGVEMAIRVIKRLGLLEKVTVPETFENFPEELRRIREEYYNEGARL